MAVRNATAVWNGSLKEGDGDMRLGDGEYEGKYSFSSRFEEGDGTNPEELIGAAHAGCFSMQLAGVLNSEGHKPSRIETTANVHLEKAGDGYKISRIELDTEGEVPNLDEETFRKHAKTASETCPVSMVLAGADISVNARLAR